MGRAIADGMGKGMTDAFSKAVIGIFEPPKGSVIYKISGALVEAG